MFMCILAHGLNFMPCRNMILGSFHPKSEALCKICFSVAPFPKSPSDEALP